MRTEASGSLPGPGLSAASVLLARPWTLLILACMSEHPRRFTDFTEMLVGISTNLLSERLRVLVQAGVVERRESGSLTLYALTSHGARLRPVLASLDAWGRKLRTDQ